MIVRCAAVLTFGVKAVAGAAGVLLAFAVCCVAAGLAVGDGVAPGFCPGGAG